MLKEKLDLVAGDFNDAAWRRDNSNDFSIIEEAFADCALPTPHWPSTIVVTWIDSWQLGLTCVCFLNGLNPNDSGKVRFHGAIAILRDVLGLRLNDQSCHHEAWFHLDFVGPHDTITPAGETLSKDSPERTVVAVPLREESGRISETMSDHSLLP